MSGLPRSMKRKQPSQTTLNRIRTQPSVPARSREAVSVFKMPDMQTSQRCRPKRKDLVRPLDAWKPQRKSLAKKQTRLNGYQGNFVREKRVEKTAQAAKIDETPSHALVYDVVHHFRAYRISSRVVRREVVRINLLRWRKDRGTGQVRASQALTEDKYHVVSVHT